MINNRKLIALIPTVLLAAWLATGCYAITPFGERPSANLQPRQILAELGAQPIHVHDPSPLIRCGKQYWVFSTGWGVISYYSYDLHHWRFGPRVFHRLPRWFQKYVPANHGFLWAPDVIYFHNRYWLYYAVSTFGAHVSAIGLASNRTLDPLDPLYHWKDCGIVISSNQATSFNAIDPSVIRTPNGKMWMSFGSFFSGIKLVQLNARTGRLLHPRHPHIYSLAKHHTIEASELYHHGHWYYLFLNWGYCCRGVHSTYNIRVGRSRRITGPYRDRRGREMMQGGGSLFLGSIGPFIGPGQSGIFDDHGKYLFTCHFYNGLRDGLSQLAVMRLAFGSSGWPELILNHP